MPRVRGVLRVRQQRYEGTKVWCRGVKECGFSDEDAKEMDNHLGSEHPTECIASDILWLNRRGEDVIPHHCPCVCSRQVVMENGSGSEETQWVRVSNVILDSCMECVINDVGQEIVHGPRDEEQEAELAAALNKWAVGGNPYALCVGCGSALCKQCMGSDKYFPNAIEVDDIPGPGRTGFQVKTASEKYQYFVCHDCAEDKERLKSSWVIRSYQKLLRTLNHLPKWKMYTTMQLHRHDSPIPRRNMYTLEHINSDHSGNKCGRCRICFNKWFAQGCKSVHIKYVQGELVHTFDEDPDETYTDESDTEDVGLVDTSNIPSGSKLAAIPSGSKQAPPSSSKQTVIRRSAVAGSADKQVNSPVAHNSRLDKRDLKKLEELVQQNSKVSKQLEARVQAEKALQVTYESMCADEKARNALLETELKQVKEEVVQERLCTVSMRAERDEFMTAEAKYTERARVLEAANYENRQIIRDHAARVEGVVEQAVKQAVKQAVEQAVEQAVKQAFEKFGESLLSQTESLLTDNTDKLRTFGNIAKQNNDKLEVLNNFLAKESSVPDHVPASSLHDKADEPEPEPESSRKRKREENEGCVIAAAPAAL